MGWVIVFLMLDTTQVYTLRQGDNIAKILHLSGLQSDIRSNIISVLRTKLDLNKCRKGEKLYITKNKNNFVSLKYEQLKATWVIDSLMRISKIEENTILILLHGVIKEGSLWSDLITAGGTPQLVLQFANEVFPWDIDFNTEVRIGDKFELLVPAKYIGDRFVGYGKIIFARYISNGQEFTGVYYSGSAEGYYNLEGKSLRRAFLKSPISYSRISSGYSHSRLHPILHKWMPHLGVDYSAPHGTPVRAIGDGIVVFAGWRRGFGKQVIIQHPNGLKSYYSHLSGFSQRACKGKYLRQGELIGRVGSTGLSTGPHLDFRLKDGDKWINPLKFKSPRADPLRGKELEEYKNYTDKLLTLIEGMNTVKKLASLSTTHL